MYWRKVLKQRVALALGVLLIAQGALLADVMDPDSATIQSIIDGGTGYTVGNLTFSNFMVSTVTSGAVTAPNAGSILVDGKVLTDGRVQLDFTGSWTAIGLGSVVDTKIRFMVACNDGCSVIEGNELGLTSANVRGDGYVIITENVYNGHPSENPGAEMIGDKIVAKFSDREQMKDLATFEGQDVIWVEKSISVADWGGDGLITLASLGGFYQNFTVTPEPGTLGVLGVGTLGLLARRYRHRRKG
jgi:hypothetical protein